MVVNQDLGPGVGEKKVNTGGGKKTNSDLIPGAVHLGVQGVEQVCRAPEGVAGGGRGSQVEGAHDGVTGFQRQNA